jgi:hypothetical protein
MKTLLITILLLISYAGYNQNVDSLNIAPNPFDTATCIYYGLAHNDTVSLYLYSMSGQTVKTFMRDSLINSGFYSICFRSDSMVNGIYFVGLNLGSHKTINKKVIKNSMSSVVENASFNGYEFYPNPTSNLLTISIDGMKTIVITDLGGKTFKTIKTRENQISLEGLTPGSYIVNVFSVGNKLLLTGKVVKL